MRFGDEQPSGYYLPLRLAARIALHIVIARYLKPRRTAFTVPARLKDSHAERALQGPQKFDEVRFLLGLELRTENQIEELDGVFKRQQAAVMKVGRRVLDAAERERLDRSLTVSDAAVDDAWIKESRHHQVMHRAVSIVGSRMALAGFRFPENQLLPSQSRLGGKFRVQLAEDIQLRCGRE